MSQLWPDIPELEGIPEVLRSGIWTKAYLSALRRWQTWLLGLLGAGVCICLCAIAGYQAGGVIGGIIGGLVGIGAGVVLFLRTILERQARRLVPELRAAAGWPPDLNVTPSTENKSG